MNKKIFRNAILWLITLILIAFTLFDSRIVKQFHFEYFLKYFDSSIILIIITSSFLTIAIFSFAAEIKGEEYANTVLPLLAIFITVFFTIFALRNCNLDQLNILGLIIGFSIFIYSFSQKIIKLFDQGDNLQKSKIDNGKEPENSNPHY